MGAVTQAIISGTETFFGGEGKLPKPGAKLALIKYNSLSLAWLMTNHYN